MKFAPVISQKYDPASISDYHLVLAHKINQDDNYAEYYSSLPESHTVILDSGTVELGYADPITIMAAKEKLNRKVIVVAPDFLLDAAKTLEGTYDFMDKTDLPDDEVMVVPQGNDWEEWVDCFKKMHALGGVRYVGLPRVAEAFPGGRAWLHQQAVQYHRSKVGMNRRLYFHLLGIQHYLEEVEWAKHFTAIRGVDSSAPSKAASVDKLCLAVDDFRKIVDDEEYNEGLETKVRARAEECVDYFAFKGV